MRARRRGIVVNTHGLSVFDLIRYRQHDHAAVLCAFDLIELDGEDLRWQPVERRKAALAAPLRPLRPLAQDQEPGSAGSEAGGRGGLGWGTCYQRETDPMSARTKQRRP